MEKKDSKNTKVFKPKSLKKSIRKNVEDGKTKVVSTKDINNKNKKERKKKTGWKIFRICLFVFIALVIIGAGIVLGVITGVIDKTEMVSPEELKSQKSISVVLDTNNNKIGSIYSQNRIIVDFDYIPKTVYDAVVSIEDQRYEKHKGIDILRTGKAVVNWVLSGGKSKFGGSTLTQQLVKNSTSDDERSWTRKIREWYRAITIEQKLNKKEIFATYINIIYMGDGCYGFEAASRNYFGKPLDKLNLAESAVIAAMIQLPEATNPYKSDEARSELLDRQKIVLSKMLELGKISKEEYDEACNYTVEFKKENEEQANGSQFTYYVEAVRKAVIADIAKEKNVSLGVAQNMLYSEGYTIYTPFDPDVQSAIDNAYNDSKLFYTDKDGKFMQSAMVVMEQSTGNVLGLIGGAGQKNGDLVLNRATEFPRQPGSCMKPLGAYGPAFELGVLSPGAGLDDAKLTKEEGDWGAKNYYPGFNGYVTARNALAQSMNLPAIRAYMKVGDANFVYNFAKNTGLNGLVPQDKQAASLAIGGLTHGLTVLEMCNAYATIANDGIHVEPRLYTKVLDRNEKEVLVKNTQAKRVMKDSTSFMLKSCLEETIKTGTASGYIKVPNMALAGKTGNTDGDIDQWFCGFTPYYTIACWNGYDERVTIGRRTYGTYPYTSMKLFNTVINAISKGQQSKSFEVPNSVTKAQLCKVSGLVPTDACRADQRGDQSGYDYVAKDSIPTATCNIHKMVKICNESGKLATEYCPETTNKSFISRDHIPTIKPNDWKYMVPTETCPIHTKPIVVEKPEEDDKNKPGTDDKGDDVNIYTPKPKTKTNTKT